MGTRALLSRERERERKVWEEKERDLRTGLKRKKIIEMYFRVSAAGWLADTRFYRILRSALVLRHEARARVI